MPNGTNKGDITEGGLHAPKPEKKSAVVKKKKQPDIKWKINAGDSPVRKRLEGKRI
jgi:hypothetical protein